ncbi:ABC transporter substrate-binding protein [Pelagibacteraceae bacterium]|nr:ABC transporter substrate-binding protein [Pelagibacteraceae bacterium]
MKKLINIVLVLVMSGFVSTSFAASIKWSMPGDSLTLDPHAQNEGPTHMVSRQVYEGLVTPGINMEILPQLAESWDATSADTWVFNIRKGVKFHDGSSLTASDIAFSINRAKTAPSDMVDLIKSIKSATATGDHTLEIITEGPNPILLNQLTQIFVMSEVWAKANGCEVSYNWDAGETSYCASNANGTGPFKITFREQDVRTVFERNADWWGDDSTHNLDQIELLPIKNDATRVAALLSGEIDYTNVVPVQDIERIKSSSGHIVKMTPQNRTIFFGMDQGSAELNSSNIKGKNPFADKRVRLAMYHALDMDAIKDKVMRGQSVPAGIITAPGVNGHTVERDQRLPYDPELSKKLLAEAGYPEGFEVTLDCPNDRYINDEAICVAAISMFAKIGVTVNLDAKTKSQHFSEVKEGDANGMTSDMYMLGWGVPTFDSHYVYSYLFDSAGSWNKVNFSNARVDELVASMGVETDLDKRNAMIAEAWDITQDDVTYLPLHHQVVNQASKSNVDVPIRMNNEPLFRFANAN